MSDEEGAICVDRSKRRTRLKNLFPNIGQHFPLHAGRPDRRLMCMPEERVRQILYEKPLSRSRRDDHSDPGSVFEKYLETPAKGLHRRVGRGRSRRYGNRWFRFISPFDCFLRQRRRYACR
jgi:DNA-binding IclR family transcriptional regulator